jgi:DNA polymerase I-like protein with 3'-5' exonuclease and polymerase domains
MKVLPVLAIIENTPKYVDVNKLKLVNEEWLIAMNKYKKQCYTYLNDIGYSYVKLQKKGKNFVLDYINFNSHIQVKNIFKHYKIKLPKKDGKKTIEKELLMQFNELNPNNVLYNFVNSYVKFKEYGKLLSYYGDKFISNLKEGKYTSTEYSQCFTATGRLSSKGNKLRKWTINMQNIPSNNDDGKKLMSCFTAEKGYMYIGSDLAGAELRLLASFSQDKLLLANFNGGGDFHSELATCTWQAMYNTKEEVTKKTMWEGISFRTKHKPINFAVPYGGSYKIIAKSLNVSDKVAKKAFRAIENKIPILLAYVKGNAEKVKRDGYLIAKSNRIKYNLSVTEAYNYEIQEANATAMKLALYLIHNYIRENNIDAKIVNTVHDAVYLVIREWTDVTFVKELMKEALQVFLNGVEADSDLIITKYWSK